MRFKGRFCGDRGDANTIEMLFVLLMLFAVMATVLDVGFYFNNRSIVANAAQNGARTAAVFGGVDANAISRKYGVNGVDADCRGFGASSAVACTVYKELKDSTSAVNMRVSSIQCGPGRTTGVGDRTWCEIKFRYRGLPLSGLSLVDIFGESRVRMTAESEVVHKS